VAQIAVTSPVTREVAGSIPAAEITLCSSVVEHLKICYRLFPGQPLANTLARKETCMMNNTYIKNGTPVGSEALCKTCSRALIISGYRESEQVTVCCYTEPNIVLPFVVCECTGYYDKNRPSWDQMEKLAIVVTPGPLKPVGFKTGRVCNEDLD